MSVVLGQREPAQRRRDLLRRLRWLQARLWTERLATGVARGLCFGLALALGGAIALVVQSGVIDRDNLALAVLVGLVGGLLWALVRPPSLLSTARIADARFQLEARLGTAVELLRRSSDNRFGEDQLRDAAAALRAARGGWPFPPAVAWREALVAVGMLVALLVALGFEGQATSLLDRLPLGQPETLAESGERQPVESPPGPAGAPRLAPQADAAASPALRTLDELRRAREAGTLSPDQAATALDRVEADLAQRSAEARRQRETLDRLARALSKVSASEAAADSIQAGDYARAGEQLGQLGQESDQLSAEAKNQLSQSLRQSATESRDNPGLAERERRAAEALAGRDYRAAQSALGALGEEVARSGRQPADQAQLAEALQRLQEERTANAAAGGPASQAARSPGAGQQAKPGGQSGGSQPGDGEGSGRGSGGGQGEATAPGQNARQPAGDGSPEKPPPDALGEAAPRLDVAGNPVDVPARPGAGDERGQQTDRASPDEQTVDRAQTAFSADRPPVPVQAGGQAERIVVPGDQRQVVRDYFGKRTGKVQP